MIAKRLFDDDQPSVPMRLFSPPEIESEPRITYPGLRTEDSKPVGKTNVLHLFAAMRDENQEDRPSLTEAEVAEARSTWPLNLVYQRAIADWRQRQLKRGEVTTGTLEKERQSVRCFADWDSHQQPPKWPAGHIWTGLPVSYLAAHYLQRWVADRLKEGVLSVGSMKVRWCHLRTVINIARRLGVIDETPKPLLQPIYEAHSAAAEGDYDDLCPTSYSNDQLEAVYRALAGSIDLQTAWVLGANTGPRTIDLFGLRWQINVRIQNDPPDMFYKAVKTGKKHWVPLAPCVVKHLQRLIASQRHLNPNEPHGLVFPELSGGDNKDPEKSRAARDRNCRLKDVLRGIGLNVDNEQDDHFKPWQVLRATCNTRLNNHRSGKGLLVTHGKDADVSSRHYWDERDAITEAVMSLPQPAAFRSLD